MDRVYEAYEGAWGGSRIQRETRDRMDWLIAKTSGTRVLDIGCSQGLLPLLLAERRAIEIVGIDILEEAIVFARTALTERAAKLKGSVTFRTADFATETPPTDEEDRFHTVIIGQVLEHLPDPGGFIAHAAKFVRSDGRLIITVPYGLWEHDEHEQTFYARDLAKLVGGILSLTELELVGSRLAAVLTKGQDTSLTAEEITDREYRFFLAKERRHVAAYAARRGTMEAVARRLASHSPAQVIKRRLRRLPFILKNGLYPRQISSFVLRTVRDNPLARQGYRAIETRLSQQGNFRSSIALRRLPALIGYGGPLKRAQARQRLLDEGYRISERLAAPSYEPIRSRVLFVCIGNDSAKQSDDWISTFRREGWDIEVATYAGASDERPSSAKNRTVHHHLGSVSQPLSGLALDARLNALANELSKVVTQRRPAVLHAAGGSEASGIVAAEAARRHGIPFVYDVGHSEETGPRNSADDLLSAKLERQVMQLADRLVCQSEATKGDLARVHEIDLEKIVTVSPEANPIGARIYRDLGGEPSGEHE